MRYAIFDSAGLPTSFGTAFEGTVPPEGATGVPDEQWNDLLSGILQYDASQKAFVPCARPVIPIGPDSVNAERDRRMFGGFTFDGVQYQTDAESIANILGAAQLAFMAISAGAQTGDLNWAGGSSPFVWIGSDNNYHPMDAQTVVGFARAAASFRSRIIYAARELKNRLAAGEQPDIRDDANWSVQPASSAPASS